MQPAGPSSRARGSTCALAGEASVEVPRYACAGNGRSFIDHARQMLGKESFDTAYDEIKKRTARKLKPEEQQAFCIHSVYNKNLRDLDGNQKNAIPGRLALHMAEGNFRGLLMHHKYDKKISGFDFVECNSSVEDFLNSKDKKHETMKDIYTTIIISGSSSKKSAVG